MDNRIAEEHKFYKGYFSAIHDSLIEQYGKNRPETVRNELKEIATAERTAA